MKWRPILNKVLFTLSIGVYPFTLILKLHVVYCLYSIQGFAVGQRGPAFLDIQIITQTNVEQASFFFTASSIGYLVGSLIAGVGKNTAF